MDKIITDRKKKRDHMTGFLSSEKYNRVVFTWKYQSKDDMHSSLF